jgi:hypothetical protein
MRLRNSSLKTPTLFSTYVPSDIDITNVPCHSRLKHWRRFQDWLSGQEEKGKTEDHRVVHLSSFRFEILSKISAAILAVGFILTPVFILFLANLGRVKMAGVVGAFVLVFLVGVLLVVDLTTHEIFIIIVA